MAKLKFKNPKTGLWEEVSGSLQNLKDGEKTSLYMDNTNEVTTPAGGTTLNPNPTPSTTSPTATGTGSFAIGSGTKATGDVSVAEGILNEASGKASHAEGAGTKAGGNTSHAEGFYTEAAGDYSYAGNYGTVAQGKKSHAEGGQTKAIGDCTHAEGLSTTAKAKAAHAEGSGSIAAGEGSHAEGAISQNGTPTTASGKGAHAEGIGTTASGDDSHSEGGVTTASGLHSHAEGYGTVAAGTASHAGGFVNKTSAPYSAVIGKYGEILGADDTRLFVVGNGTSETNRSNAFEVYADGTGYLNKKKILVEGDAGGGGDVTTAGDNYFTGANSFSEIVDLDGGITVGTTGIECNGPISLKAIQATARYIDGLVTPTSDDHAANKKYVDDKVITSATANATTLSYYEPATASVKLNNGVLDFTFGIPQGEPAENPCLIEGTQITMADNTTKSVEDLKPGDVILSYDPVKKEKTNAVVIDAYKTGESKNFDVYSFENGKYLTVYGIHGFYANELGYVKNIQNINKTNELIDENLDTTYLIVKRTMPLRDKPRSRYMIISSNNLYFANGILLGHSPWIKGQYCIKYGVEVPQSIKETYQSEIDNYNNYDSFINTPEYHAEISEQYAKLANAVNEIKIYKDKLTKTDYKAQKYLEGVLPEAEWLQAKADRAAWR